MRLHTLEITAFGPFAETVRVDFDALSDAGLFLLSGPTGAGKSSVLDAVCFALYGDVPGDRSSAKRLRSDQADEGAAPRVVLEVTLSGRRFRLDRSPAWQRPKKRGTGTTTEQARVTLSERVTDGGSSTWRPLSTRLDETGHLVSGLVGMNLPQFCQVALLPQGRFQAFLRAGSDERHALLQQVFQTGRFDRVEAWLRNRRLALHRESEAHRRAVADQVSRVSEVASSPAPLDWVEVPESLTTWTSTLTADTEDQLAASTQELDAAEVAEVAARAEAEAGVRLAESFQLLRETQERAAVLDAARDERHREGARLEAARRAAAVRPLHEASLAAEDSVDSARASLDEARHALALEGGDHVDDVEGIEGIEALRRRTIAQLAEVDRLRPLAARADVIAAERSALDEQLVSLRARAEELDVLAEELPRLLEDLRAQVQAVSSSAAQVEILRAQVASLRDRQAAAQLVDELATLASAAEGERCAAVTELQGAKEAWLAVRESRLEGMAAEIASSLVVGGSCPVCGSDEHPSPATVADGTPDVAAERTARRLVDDLEVVVEARTLHARDLESRLATARGAAGSDVADLATLAAQTEDSLRVAEGDLAELPGLTDRVTRTEDRLARLTRDRESAAAETAATTSALERLAVEHDSCVAQVASALAGTDCADLDSLAEHLRTCQAAAEAAAAAHRRHEAAAARLAQTRTDTRRAAADAGFRTPDAAAESWLAPDEVERLAAWVSEHDRARDRVDHTLADPALRLATAGSPPDLAGLTARHDSARQAAATIRRTHDALAHRRARLTGLGAELEQALAAWLPVRADHEAAASLSSFVEGKSPDNRLQMRLSAYVLAHRLSQVVQAANLRLGSMSDHRYSLVHTGHRGAGEKRGGLSLVIRDDWSGESRDPATLSGGETFVVSLALALGLADVITAEAGGADLDTLFVDEGFGSLDAETLDDVMDTLDSLRDGGRVVGVVSHVAEMQVRIPTQLRVVKARHGSRVTQ